MSNLWIDQKEIQQNLADYFGTNRQDLERFGSTVNQTFEAFVFASLLNWYRKRGWFVELKHPKGDSNFARLKFSTRGRPNQYTYALCVKNNERIQIRHSLRIATRYHRKKFRHLANIVLDVSVIKETDLSNHKSDDHVENKALITFGEAKHMSAFAELIANFIGLVHEMSPKSLRRIRVVQMDISQREHIAPFLYVSGYLNPTAQGLLESIRERRYDIDIYDHQSGGQFGLVLPTISKPTP